MASNFVDDIDDDSEDEFWIAASYVSVFNLNQDDPGYFEIG